MFVVNKADLANPSKTMFNIASGLREKDGWRPPVLKTVALNGTGVPAFVDALVKFRLHLDNEGLREKQFRGRIEEELVEAAFSDFYSETVDRLKKGKEWSGLVSQVVERKLDPETAASRLVRTISRMER